MPESYLLFFRILSYVVDCFSYRSSEQNAKTSE